MIKYNYVIVRDEGDETEVTYKPDKFPTEIKDLTYIEGPNSSGKSTLLNILALAFYGLDTDLNPALRNKLNDLLDLSHQKLSFDVNIKNKKLNLELFLEKKNPENKEIEIFEIIKGEKQKIVSDKFHKKYNLIYDIPDNPTERLIQLTFDIKHDQHKLGNKIGFLKTHIFNIVNEIRRSRDPKKISKYNLEQEKVKEDYNEILTQCKNKEDLLKNIQEYTYCKFLLKYKKLYNSLDDKKQQRLQEENIKLKKTKKISKEYIKLYNLYNNKVDNMENNFNEVTCLIEDLIPRSENHHLDIWKEINLKQSIQEPDFKDTLQFEGTAIKNILLIINREISKNHNLEEVEFIKDLIIFLESYSDKNIIIPGFKKNITEMIQILQKSTIRYEGVMQKRESIENAIKSLDELLEEKEQISKELIPQLKELHKSHSKLAFDQKIIEELEQADGKLKEKRRFYKGKIDYYTRLCTNIKINIIEVEQLFVHFQQRDEKNYGHWNEENLHKKISNMNNEIHSIEMEKEKKDDVIKYLGQAIIKLENQQTHKYQEYLNELEKYLKVTEKLEQKFKVDFDTYINNLLPKSQYHFMQMNSNEKKYYKAVFEFLAAKVTYIRHIDVDYKVIKIDLIKKEIITDTGKIIKLTDLGTGQSQAAYLMGLLNTNDNRIIIAFFDEVAMMDDNSLKPIYKKLISLYKKKHLLCGIVVQKSNKVNVKSLI